MSRAKEWIMSDMDLDNVVNVMMRLFLSLITNLGFFFFSFYQGLPNGGYATFQKAL